MCSLPENDKFRKVLLKNKLEIYLWKSMLKAGAVLFWQNDFIFFDISIT